MAIITKDSINQFVAENNPRAITQTGYWLDIEKANQKKAFIIYTTNKSEITASVLLVKQSLPFNKNYLYAPYGPVIRKNLAHNQIGPAIENLILEIKKFINLQNTIFIRFEPFYQDCHSIYDAMLNTGFKATHEYTQPKDTLILNLQQTEDQIFRSFHQKTRYNIRLAHKRNIKVHKSTEISEIKYFYQLLLNTCDRNKIRPHPQKHYQNILKILGPKDIAYVYHAYHDKKIIASIIVTYFGGVASYLHGASSNTYRNLMPNYALQWQAIRDAISKECRFYDFGGIAPAGSPANHPWMGITKFKQGFNGIEVPTMGHLEKTLSPFWYFAYKTARSIQK
jgi:lipid II:glycine glycyltransferase (peptidoglycan interpeptide bridge formation enzyme)